MARRGRASGGSSDALRGADDLLALGQRLKAEGRGDLLKQLKKELQAAAKPLVPRTRAVALRTLPQRGGLAKRVSKAPQRVTARMGGTTATVRITLPGAKKGNAATQANRGFVRHPVFNRTETFQYSRRTARRTGVASTQRRIFVRQEVPAATGWFSDTLKQEAPAIRDDLVDVIKDVERRLTRG